MSKVVVYDENGKAWDVDSDKVAQMPGAVPPPAAALVAPRLPQGAPPQFSSAAAASTRGVPEWSGGAGFNLGRFALNSLPAAGGMVGDVIGGALATPLDAFLGPAGTWGGGVAGAGIGGGLGEGARQGILTLMGHQQADPLGAMRQQAIAQAIAAGGGRIVSGAAHMAGGSLMRGAMRESPAVVRQSMKVARRAAGPTADRVSAETVAAADKAIAERTPVGARPFIGGGAGANQVQAKIAEQMAIADAARDAAEVAGHTNTIFDVTGSPAIQSLRSAVESPGNTLYSEQSRWLNRQLDALVQRNRGQRVGGRLGPLRRITPPQLHDMVQMWQQAAKPVYDASGKPLAVQPMRVRLNAALAKAGADLQRSIPNYGDVIGDANDKISALIPLKEATLRAEERIPGRGWMPTWPEALVGGGTGGASGFGVHGPEGAALGTLAGALGAHALNNPAITSRLALGLTSPVARYGPLLAAHGLAGFMAAPQDNLLFPPDNSPNGQIVQGR